MRISDGSSDVCSSDLSHPTIRHTARVTSTMANQPCVPSEANIPKRTPVLNPSVRSNTGRTGTTLPSRYISAASLVEDRKSVVSGKSVSGRVDLGRRRSLKKKKKKKVIVWYK